MKDDISTFFCAVKEDHRNLCNYNFLTGKFTMLVEKIKMETDQKFNDAYLTKTIIISGDEIDEDEEQEVR